MLSDYRNPFGVWFCFVQAEDGIRDLTVTGVQTCALPICFMATQEPNVYAGLAVAVGGLMHARPRFFAKVMGELMFGLGEDKLIFGADYAIWEPRWQVEGFVDWNMPDGEEFSDYAKLSVTAKKKILGLNAARLYGLEVPAGLGLDETPKDTATL